MKNKQTRTIPDEKMDELMDKFDTYIETQHQEIGAMERQFSEFNRIASNGFQKIQSSIGNLTKTISKLSRLDSTGKEIITNNEISRIETHTREIQNNTEVIWEESANENLKNHERDTTTQKLLREIRNPLESLSYSLSIPAFDKMMENASDKLSLNQDELENQGIMVRISQASIDALNANRLGIDEWIKLNEQLKKNNSDDKETKTSLFDKITMFLKARWDKVDRTDLMNRRIELKNTMFGRMAWAQLHSAIDVIKASMIDMRVLMAWNVITGVMGSILSFLTSPVGLGLTLAGLGVVFRKELSEMFMDLFGVNGDKKLGDVLAEAMFKAGKEGVFGGSDVTQNDDGTINLDNTYFGKQAAINKEKNRLLAESEKMLNEYEPEFDDTAAMVKAREAAKVNRDFLIEKLAEAGRLEDLKSLDLYAAKDGTKLNPAPKPSVEPANQVQPAPEMSTQGDGIGTRQYIEDVQKLVLEPLGSKEQITKFLKEHGKRGKLSEKEYYEVLNDFMEQGSDPEFIQGMIESTPGLSEYLQKIQKTNLVSDLNDTSAAINKAAAEAKAAEDAAADRRLRTASNQQNNASVINTNNTTINQSSIRPYRDSDTPGIRSYS